MGVAWKYGKLGRDNALALKKFKAALGRVKAGKAPYFGYSVDYDGFSSFLAEIGSIPADMARPSLGRIDHSLGYQSGNVFWQELSDNCAENGRRTGPKVGAISKGRRLSEEHKSRISESMKRKLQGAF